MTSGLLLLIAVACLLGGIACAFRAPKAWLVITVAGHLAALAAALWVLATGVTWEWHPNFLIGGERIHWRLDCLSAFFLVLLALLGGVASVYAREYWPDREHPASAPSGRAWWNVLMGTMGGVLISANGLHFIIFWELFTVSAYFLMTRERHILEVRKAGWLFLAVSHVATLCLFAFFACLAARTGSWELGPMHEHANLAPLFWLALLGFGVKAGIFPLHVWLPSAHANAPSHVSAILSGVSIKMGVYGLVRFTGWLPLPSSAGWVVAALGVISAILGVAFALGQHDFKRLLAYHSVENIGIILIGLGFAMIASSQGCPIWGQLAFVGGMLHVWNHGLFKALLFLGAGAVLHSTGTREMSRLGGLWRTMPWTAGLFTLGAAAIAGLPPLNGFVSEWLVYLGLFDAVSTCGSVAWAAIPAAVLLGMTGALALACFIKVCGVVFLGLPRSKAASHAHECGWSMRMAMLVLAVACVAIGVVPALFCPLVVKVAGEWQPAWAGAPLPAPLLMLGSIHFVVAVLAGLAALLLWRHVKRTGMAIGPTWDCGFAEPTPRIQYTAGSFAGIITGWFSWILRPRRHAHLPQGPFPEKAVFEEHTPETVLEDVLQPIGSLVMRISTAVRRLQHGRLQAYIFYLLAGLAALALLALMEGMK